MRNTLATKLIKLTNRRRSSAGSSRTSTAGAVTSLILVGTLSSFVCINVYNIYNPTSNAYADSISLSVDTSTIVANLAPNTTSGQFASSDNATISVSTSSNSGYTLSIASLTGSTDLTNTTDNVSKITSISSAISESDFKNTDNTKYNNKWGYRPSSIYDSTNEQNMSNTSYRPLPNDNGETIAKTSTANSTADTYTLAVGTRASSDTTLGSYTSDAFIITAVANSSLISCDSTKLCVEYDGNGLTFDNELLNRVNYDSTTTQAEITKYSHTANISDDGTQDGSYSSNLATKDVVTIPGVSSLHVKITYGTESNWDMLYVFRGEYTGDISRNMDQTSTGWLYKYMGGNNTTTTVEIDIEGNTATFGFYSDGSQNYYGYYAIITGTSVIMDRAVSSGEYSVPTGANAVFHGWSDTQTTAGGGLPSDVEYADESAVMNQIPGDNGDTKVLYAVWQQNQEITFAMDGNVTGVAVLDDSGSTVGTITANGQSLILNQGSTYTISPTFEAGYILDVISIASGAGTLNGDQFTVGAGPSIVDTTSIKGNTIANSTYMQEVDSCPSSLATGQVYVLKDSRDNTEYHVAKLADGKCWMLDNLAIDLTSVSLSTLRGKTNASNTTLAYLKGSRTGSTSDRYATTGVSSSWGSSWDDNSYSAPLINATDKTKKITYGSYGVGNGYVGVYYNYCAASAGSYCFGDGYSSSGSPSGDAIEDICPSGMSDGTGWRMPTGGDDGEYAVLYSKYNNATAASAGSIQYNLSTPLSGFFLNGSADRQGNEGEWWSSTRLDDGSMFTLLVDSTAIWSLYSVQRYNGLTIRCVFGG